MDLKRLRINGPRLRGTLEEMAKIGATPGGGVQRLSLSNEDKEARDLFIQWLDALGLEITIDEMGNIFGRREVFRTLHENQVETERPLVIVNWTNEEGTRFPPAMGASGVWAGALERDGLPVSGQVPLKETGLMTKPISTATVLKMN